MTRSFVTFLLVLGICQPSLLENIGEEEVDLIYRLPSGVVIPTAYKIHLKPDFEKLIHEGQVNITLIALKLTNNILILNSKALLINDVKFVDLNTTKSFETEWFVEETYELLVIKAKQQLQREHHYSLQIKYSIAFTNRLPESSENQFMKADEFSLNVGAAPFKPTFARRMFPCWDEPIYKAKFSISVTHSKALQAISNTDVLKIQDEGDMITTIFRETPPMSTYLVAILLSDHKYEEYQVNNFVYRVWAPESQLNQTDLALKTSKRILEELNSYTNIPYQTYMPDKIDHILEENILFENWGVVSYRGNQLLYDKNLSTTRTRINILTAIANKICHQWFGNLVSPKWWRYVGLNDGFVTYFQYFILHQILPKWRLNDMFVVEVMQNMMHIDAFVGVRLITQDVITTRTMFNNVNFIAYRKGASIIRMMSYALTEEYFRKGVEVYLKSHALGNADWNDLFESLEKGLPPHEKRRLLETNTLKDVMQNWVKSPAYPLLTVTRVEEGYQLTQEPFLFRVEEDDDYHPTNWWIPITYVEQFSPFFNETCPARWMPPKKKPYILRSSTKSGWFIFNTQQTGYYRVNYDVRNWQLLMHELKKGKKNSIHVLNRAQIYDDVFTLAKVGSLNYTLALDMSLCLMFETDYMPWQSGFRHLSFLRNMYRTPEQYFFFKRYVAYLMKTLSKDVGYEPKVNDTNLIRMLRIDVIKWACEAEVKECEDYVKKVFKQWLHDPTTKLDVNLKNEIFCAGIKHMIPEAWTMTLNRITASMPDEDDRKDQMFPLACYNSTTILLDYLVSTLNSGYPIDLKTAARDIISRHPEGANLVLDFIQDRREDIVQLPDFENTMRVIADGIGEVYTSYKPELLQFGSFLLRNNLGHLWRLVTTQVNSNMIWMDRYNSTVDEWLDAHSNVFDPNYALMKRVERAYAFARYVAWHIVTMFFLLIAGMIYIGRLREPIEYYRERYLRFLRTGQF